MENETSLKLLNNENEIVQADETKVVFLFPGAGTQYFGMGNGLYEQVPFFREKVSHCVEYLKSELGVDLSVFFESGEVDEDVRKSINETRNSQIMTFVVEYCLYELLKHWGVKADVCVGHSLGEFAAATASGVFTIEEALEIVWNRGRIFEERGNVGRMLTIYKSAEDVKKEISKFQDIHGKGGILELSLNNSPRVSVVSGDEESISKFSHN